MNVRLTGRYHNLPWLALGLALAATLAAILAPWIAPHDPVQQDLLARFTPPAWFAKGSSDHFLGADSLGRDVLSNIIFGLRISLLAGVVSVLISVTLGTVIGTTAGYFKGSLFDSLAMRAIDVQLSVPAILIAMGVLAVVGRGLWIMIAVIGLVGWADYGRLSRGSTLLERNKEYAVAAIVVGASQPVILFRHILPNITGPLLVEMSVDVPKNVTLAATLSFLGLGVPATTPDLGLRIAQEYQYILSGVWWPSIMPGIALMIIVMCGNVIGDWIRDAADPTRRLR